MVDTKLRFMDQLYHVIKISVRLPSASVDAVMWNLNTTVTKSRVDDDDVDDLDSQKPTMMFPLSRCTYQGY
jgi:hypothetical protein